MQQIENYKILPLGNSRDLSQKIFGDYKVLYRTEVPKNSHSQQAHWLCQCNKCFKYTIIPAYTLQHSVNQCNCIYDLTNKRFGRWTVLYKTDKKTKNRTNIWHCRCDCGNEKDVDSYTLKSGQSKSCGCIQKEFLKENNKKKRLNIMGQRFGKLVALYPIFSNSDQHTKWHCKCDCGNEKDIDLGNLRQGFSKSCGCTNSTNEEKIIKLLNNNNIQFEYQHSFHDLKNKIFDFYVNNQYIIEYDGIQHFKYSGTGWDTKEHFIRTRNGDMEKNNYCFKNNIPIIRIPYNASYDIKDLVLETTNFLLTKNKLSEYYNQES